VEHKLRNIERKREKGKGNQNIKGHRFIRRKFDLWISHCAWKLPVTKISVREMAP